MTTMVSLNVRVPVANDCAFVRANTVNVVNVEKSIAKRVSTRRTCCLLAGIVKPSIVKAVLKILVKHLQDVTFVRKTAAKLATRLFERVTFVIKRYVTIVSIKGMIQSMDDAVFHVRKNVSKT